MLVHNVFFWLRRDLSAEQRAEFVRLLQALQDVPAVAACYLGVPAAVAERPVVDRTWDYCLTILLPDVAAHDAYQQHALHQAFLDACKHLWLRVAIADSQSL